MLDAGPHHGGGRGWVSSGSTLRAAAPVRLFAVDVDRVSGVVADYVRPTGSPPPMVSTRQRERAAVSRSRASASRAAGPRTCPRA
jgi:hypothetical protein